MEGAVKAICGRLVVAEVASRTSRDLAEQCIKVSFPSRNCKIFKNFYENRFIKWVLSLSGLLYKNQLELFTMDKLVHCAELYCGFIIDIYGFFSPVLLFD